MKKVATWGRSSTQSDLGQNMHMWHIQLDFDVAARHSEGRSTAIMIIVIITEASASSALCIEVKLSQRLRSRLQDPQSLVHLCLELLLRFKKHEELTVVHFQHHARDLACKFRLIPGDQRVQLLTNHLLLHAWRGGSQSGGVQRLTRHGSWGWLLRRALLHWRLTLGRHALWTLRLLSLRWHHGTHHAHLRHSHHRHTLTWARHSRLAATRHSHHLLRLATHHLLRTTHHGPPLLSHLWASHHHLSTRHTLHHWRIHHARLRHAHARHAPLAVHLRWHAAHLWATIHLWWHAHTSLHAFAARHTLAATLAVLAHTARRVAVPQPIFPGLPLLGQSHVERLALDHLEMHFCHGLGCLVGRSEAHKTKPFASAFVVLHCRH
mmetsp:Transcript_46839/g.86061  ORF Transcript_46839/g.86061 Transcript_46839/m.86061 type:complete len:379 (-) Transcript_46839:921-2057(-)